jgi:hypothetical protein
LAAHPGPAREKKGAFTGLSGGSGPDPSDPEPDFSLPPRLMVAQSPSFFQKVPYFRPPAGPPRAFTGSGRGRFLSSPRKRGLRPLFTRPDRREGPAYPAGSFPDAGKRLPPKPETSLFLRSYET